MSTVRPSRKVVVWLGLAILLAYALWLGGPYLRSIVVRNAAVTTWIQTARTPIDGLIVNPLPIGQRIGADGRIVTIENPRADTVALARARADLDESRERVASLTRLANEATALAATREARATGFGANFKRNLDVKIGGLKEYMTLIRRQLDLQRTEAKRQAELVSAGIQSPAVADAAAARVAELERAVTDSQTSLDQITLHRSKADAGMFMLDDGSDAATEQRSFEDTRLGLDRVRSELAIAQKQQRAAQQIFDDATRLFERQQAAHAIGHAGGIVWNYVLAAGASVTSGAQVASWIDCRIMLVDAPVSDAELSLLRPGAPAEVVLEGERRARKGTILLMRGAAATIGAADLAAVAKGRHTGIGQVLITLESTPADVDACPIGRAAFVHFPDVSVLDIVRARLRF